MQTMFLHSSCLLCAASAIFRLFPPACCAVLCPALPSNYFPLQEAGATPAIELAFTIADGLEYIRYSKVKGRLAPV
jgi:hypothetical protein